MTDIWLSAVRNSTDRLAALLAPLGDDQLRRMSYDTEWTIADVASHLGSQSEIFGLFLDTALNGEPVPAGEVFQSIWARWNALSPAHQAAQSIAVNEQLVSRIEHLTDGQQAAFQLDMFGAVQDLDGFLGVRLAEHAVHTWDIAVALDPTATISADAVALLVDKLGPVAARGGVAMPGEAPVAIETTTPERLFVLNLDPLVTLGYDGEQVTDPVQLTAEEFVRLVYGRLDIAGTATDDGRLTLLRSVFPGF